MLDSSTSDSPIDVLPATRQAGVCLHISSLPGRYGIGEIGQEAFSFIDALQRMQLSVWQFLPLGPTGYGDSPYQPLSSFAGNELFIAIDDLIDRGLLSAEEVEALTQLPETYADYGRLIPLKTQLLALAASRFTASTNHDFEAFLERHDTDWLHDYALFRVLKNLHEQRPWTEWAEKFRRREADALRGVEIEYATDISAIKVLQFLFFAQWQRLRGYAADHGVRLFGDLPIYIALDSADAWATPELLSIDADGKPSLVAGVPPDYFSEDGQLWGNPIYDWARQEDDNFSWWANRIRHSLMFADLLRVDHFRGFESYWAIPADSATAREGRWLPGPGDKLFDALQRQLGSLPIVAEDLGVITPEVDALRDRWGLPGMAVLQFAVFEDGFEISQVAENRVCYTGTHDNDTTVGWFYGSSEDPRSDHDIHWTQQAALALTGGPPETIAADLVRAAFASDARLAVAPMQDFLGLGFEARLNTPGSAGGNWQWRLIAAQLTDEVCDNVENAVRASKREAHNDRPEQ